MNLYSLVPNPKLVDYAIIPLNLNAIRKLKLPGFTWILLLLQSYNKNQFIAWILNVMYMPFLSNWDSVIYSQVATEHLLYV